MSEVRYLGLADYLLIAEAVLGTPAEDLAYVAHLDLAGSALAAPAAEFGGVEFYGNKRIGFMCAVEFAERSGYEWTSPLGDQPSGEETVRVIEGVAAGEIDEKELAEWIRARLRKD